VNGSGAEMHNLTRDALQRELGRFWPIEVEKLPNFIGGGALRDVTDAPVRRAGGASVSGAETYLIRRPISAVS
jgi:hypothetical protein